MQGAVQLVQEIHLFLGVMPVIPHELPDDRVVLLFHMGVVVLVIGTRPGESDVTSMTETHEVAVHELASVVRMERDDLPRIPVETRLQGSDHVDLCFRPYCSCLCPSGRLIGHREGPAEISRCLSSIMSYQIDSQGTGDVQKGVHAGLDRDPATQRSTPGMGDAMETIHAPLCCQE